MAEPTDAMLALAQKLITLEAKNDSGSNAAFRVIEKLRILIIRFSGADGFNALLRRAFALARQKDPTFNNLTLKSDGSIASIEGLSSTSSLALTAHLLDLMSLFIGPALTLTLLNDVWQIDQ